MKDWSAVRAEWDRELPVAASRARLAIIALGASAALQVAKIAGSVWRPRLMDALANIQILLLFATAVLFLRWLRRAVRVAGAMLAVFVVRAIESRLRERFRRVSNATDEELDAWEIRA